MVRVCGYQRLLPRLRVGCPKQNQLGAEGGLALASMTGVGANEQASVFLGPCIPSCASGIG